MASSIPLQVAETIQTAHINTDPSAEHDINPSTATSKREPIVIEQTQQSQEAEEKAAAVEEPAEKDTTTTATTTKTTTQEQQKQQQQQYTTLFQQSLHAHGRNSNNGFDEEEEEEEHDDIEIDEDEDDEGDEEGHIPFSILRAKPRGAGAGTGVGAVSGAGRGKHHLPPIPDLRYEQSYLHSIRDADTWWKVGLITARDQVMMPFAQGILYNLAICGWQHWNRNARVHGSSLGARLRRWWYGVNNWAIPPPLTTTSTSGTARPSPFKSARFEKYMK